MSQMARAKTKRPKILHSNRWIRKGSKTREADVPNKLCGLCARYRLILHSIEERENTAHHGQCMKVPSEPRIGSCTYAKRLQTSKQIQQWACSDYALSDGNWDVSFARIAGSR
mmetsp:Transcript_6817/g.41591  ORF Transcript_6817/g.41591 Transcript_6817/m.41591 type:complete len:113 (-) Transcript_6817:627-965(-)